MKSKLALLILQCLLVLGFYFLSRIIFTLVNIHYFPNLNFEDFFSICGQAIRFDISTFFATNSLYLLLFFFPFSKQKIPQSFKKIQFLFIASNAIAFLFEWSDWFYFPYNQKRATADMLKMIGRKADFWNQLPSLISQYWHLPLIAILLLYLFFICNKYLCSKTFLANTTSIKKQPQIFSFILIIGLGILGIRGGWQYVPINLNSAIKASPNNQFVPIVLNTPFSIMSTLGKQQLSNEKYFDDSVAAKLIPIEKHFQKKKFDKKNIVVLILESFSKEFTGIGGFKSYTPFLDSLMEQSLVCTNAFANGYRSAEAIPAILAGIPSIAEEPFTTSIYGNNRITSIPKLLKPFGYHSCFYHGGTNGTMSFDIFAKNAGFDNYIGRNEYNNEKDFDGSWGIWDEPFLQFCISHINQNLQEPFMASVFTLSSHPPYKIPHEYEEKIPEGNLPIHRPIGYTDLALRHFFETAKKQKWYANTLFIIVSDHCSPLSKDEYYNFHQGRFAIPIIYFMPSDSNLKKECNLLTQQIDILPTIMDYLGYPKKFFAFGNSILSPSKTRFCIQQWSGNQLWTLNEYFLRCAGTKPNGLFSLHQDKLCQDNLIDRKKDIRNNTEAYLKAFRQQYSQHLRNNQMWIE